MKSIDHLTQKFAALFVFFFLSISSQIFGALYVQQSCSEHTIKENQQFSLLLSFSNLGPTPLSFDINDTLFDHLNLESVSTYLENCAMFVGDPQVTTGFGGGILAHLDIPVGCGAQMTLNVIAGTDLPCSIPNTVTIVGEAVTAPSILTLQIRAQSNGNDNKPLHNKKVRGKVGKPSKGPKGT